MAFVFPSVARQVLLEDVSRIGQPSYSPPFRPFGLSISRNSLEGHDSVKGEKPTKVSVRNRVYLVFSFIGHLFDVLDIFLFSTNNHEH